MKKIFTKMYNLLMKTELKSKFSKNFTQIILSAGYKTEYYWVTQPKLILKFFGCKCMLDTDIPYLKNLLLKIIKKKNEIKF